MTAQSAREKIHKQFCSTAATCRFREKVTFVGNQCKKLDDLLADLLSEGLGQQAHEPVTEFRVETFDGDVWHSVGSAVFTVEAARVKREGLRPRAPEQRWRIVRWDETSTVVEEDE